MDRTRAGAGSEGRRLLSLAAGTVLDVPPERIAHVAAEAGFDAVGLWFDPDTWTDVTVRAVADSLAATGLVALDIEPVILGRGDDPGERLVDAAAAVGARHVLVASGPAPRGEVVDRLGRLAQRASGSEVALVLEFLPIFSVATLSDACSVVAEVGEANVGVLIDTLHLDRSGGSPSDLDALEPTWLPYLQVADAGPVAPVTPEALREEALHGRLLPGEGVLPIGDVLAAVPGVPLSIELRSRALNERFDDPVARARAVREACVDLLER